MLLLLTIFALAAAQDCSFTLPGGEVVNLSSLRNTGPPDFEIFAADGYIYRGNICGSVSAACEGDSSAIATQWTSYSSCVAVLGRMYDIWGSTLAPQVAYIDASDPSQGFSLTFTGGDVCFDMMSYVDRSVTYNFRCDSGKGSLSNAYESTTLCKYTYDFTTKLACTATAPASSASTNPVPASPSSGLSQGSKFLIFLALAIVLYCGLGIAYNKYTSEASLSESIPHKEFWMEIPSLASDGFTFSITKLRSGMESAKGKMSSHTHEPI
jgi:hypothetical protein